MKTVDFRRLPLATGDIVLDLGCGEGRHVISAYVEADIHSVGVDLSLKDLKITRERFEHFAEPDNDAKSFGLSSASALNLPFADNTFDKVICSEVLEHIPDYRGALREIERVLKPGGLFCASVPRRWPEKICWALSEAITRCRVAICVFFAATSCAVKLSFWALHITTVIGHTPCMSLSGG